MLELHNLRIDHHKPELIRRKPVQERRDDGVDADRFARTGAARDEQVRHFREVGDDGVAVNVFAERERNPSLGVPPLIGLKQVPDDHHRFDRIRNFDADGAFAGHRGQNVNALGLERGSDIVVQRSDLFKLHSRRGMQFVSRDRRTLGDIAERNFNLELRECLLHQPRIGHQFLLRLGRLQRQVRVLEKIHCRQTIIADERCGSDGDRLGPLRRGLRPPCRAVRNVNNRLGLRFSRFSQNL